VELSGYDRPDHDRRYAVECARLRALGWAPRTSFEKGIASTVSWYGANRDWWSAKVVEAEALYAD
jgi:dTDP-glucose 4,6-dehydratase